MATTAAALPRFRIRQTLRVLVAFALGSAALVQLLEVVEHAAGSPWRAGALLMLGSVQAATAVALATTTSRAAILVALATVILTLAISASPASTPPAPIVDAPVGDDGTMSPADYLHQHGEHGDRGASLSPRP